MQEREIIILRIGNNVHKTRLYFTQSSQTLTNKTIICSTVFAVSFLTTLPKFVQYRLLEEVILKKEVVTSAKINFTNISATGLLGTRTYISAINDNWQGADQATIVQHGTTSRG